MRKKSRSKLIKSFTVLVSLAIIGFAFLFIQQNFETSPVTFEFTSNDLGMLNVAQYPLAGKCEFNTYYETFLKSGVKSSAQGGVVITKTPTTGSLNIFERVSTNEIDRWDVTVFMKCSGATFRISGAPISVIGSSSHQLFIESYNTDNNKIFYIYTSGNIPSISNIVDGHQYKLLKYTVKASDVNTKYIKSERTHNTYVSFKPELKVGFQFPPSISNTVYYTNIKNYDMSVSDTVTIENFSVPPTTSTSIQGDVKVASVQVNGKNYWGCGNTTCPTIDLKSDARIDREVIVRATIQNWNQNDYPILRIEDPNGKIRQSQKMTKESVKADATFRLPYEIPQDATVGTWTVKVFTSERSTKISYATFSVVDTKVKLVQDDPEITSPVQLAKSYIYYEILLEGEKKLIGDISTSAVHKSGGTEKIEGTSVLDPFNLQLFNIDEKTFLNMRLEPRISLELIDGRIDNVFNPKFTHTIDITVRGIKIQNPSIYAQPVNIIHRNAEPIFYGISEMEISSGDLVDNANKQLNLIKKDDKLKDGDEIKIAFVVKGDFDLVLDGKSYKARMADTRFDYTLTFKDVPVNSDDQCTGLSDIDLLDCKEKYGLGEFQGGGKCEGMSSKDCLALGKDVHDGNLVTDIYGNQCNTSDKTVACVVSDTGNTIMMCYDAEDPAGFLCDTPYREKYCSGGIQCQTPESDDEKGSLEQKGNPKTNTGGVVGCLNEACDSIDTILKNWVDQIRKETPVLAINSNLIILAVVVVIVTIVIFTIVVKNRR